MYVLKDYAKFVNPSNELFVGNVANTLPLLRGVGRLGP